MTPEQLSKWSSIAEISSSVAILATLFLLLIEVRQNTQAIQQSAEATRLEALDAGVGQFSSFRRLLLSDDELLELWEEGCDRELERIEALKYSQLAQEFFFLQRNVYERREALEPQGEPVQFQQTVARLRRCSNLRTEFERTAGFGAVRGWFALIDESLKNSGPSGK